MSDYLNAQAIKATPTTSDYVFGFDAANANADARFSLNTLPTTAAVTSALAGKMVGSNNLSELVSAPTARTNLGLGDSATKNVGTEAGTVAAGDDSRLSDARTPSAHAASHKSAGSDAIRIDELKVGTDVTTLNASASQHGLLPKLSGNATDALRGDGTWQASDIAGITRTPNTIAYSGSTATIDFSKAINVLTVTKNTVFAVSNLVAGAKTELHLISDAVGNWELDFDTNLAAMGWSDNGTPLIPSVLGKGADLWIDFTSLGTTAANLKARF